MISLGTYRVDADHLAYFGYDGSDFSSQYYIIEDSVSEGGTYSEGEVLGFTCNGTTKITYKFTGAPPYTFSETEENSPSCGYTPIVCDINFPSSPITTDCSPADNDGTVKAFAIGSYSPITYTLGLISNTTGYFTGLVPNTYLIVASDPNGCSIGINFTIHAYASPLTRYKYRLAFASVKEQIGYELKFLDQKHQYDASVYPLDITGTDSPISYKKTNTNEDKTEAIIASSLTINAYVNGIFDPAEFANSQEQDWKIEMWRRQVISLPASSFAGTLTEATSPDFIDGGLRLMIDGNVVYTINSSGSQTALSTVGQPYSIQAFTQLAPLGPNAKIRLTIQRGATIIFDKQITAIDGANILKTGIVQNEAYIITVTTIATTAPVTLIDIDDNADPFSKLEWQGWLLPDELQDYYADPNYAIQLIATDGLLSLKGALFGDPSKFSFDPQGNKFLDNIFGIKQWVYLVKICLDQLNYDYGNTILLSSLTYNTYTSEQWLSYSTWADLFYDQNGTPTDPYSALEILLQAFHLQLFQDRGSFVIWDINDAYYRNNNIVSSIFLQSLFIFNADFTTISPYTIPPANMPLGFLQLVKPINPQQTLNYDKAFQTLEADISFDLLSVLYPNPGFELNAVQGVIPQGFTTDSGDNYWYANYDPYDPLSPLSPLAQNGAYAGQWDLKVKSIWNNQDINAIYARLTSQILIDQSNKKLNLSFYWRKHDANSPAGWPFSTPCIFLIFTSSLGHKYNWDMTGTPQWRFYTSEPPTVRLAINPIVNQDYSTWNNYSITTDAFPFDTDNLGTGTLDIRICIPFPYDNGGGALPIGSNMEVDIDNLVLTLSDNLDTLVYPTGEKHIITNRTTYAKSEKKTVDLKLFNYLGNKRVSGNLFYGNDYATGIIANSWFFRLSSEQLPDRLPANVIKRIAKNYQRPMYKWQGDINSDQIDFYMIFSILGIANKLFIPFTIEMDLRNSTGNIVLIETDDSPSQSTYQYIPIYEQNSRSNTS